MTVTVLIPDEKMWKGFCQLLNIDWDDVVSAFKAYLAINGEDAVTFEEWLHNIHSQDDDDVLE